MPNQTFFTKQEVDTAICYFDKEPKVNHSGERFGRLTLLRLGEPYINPFNGKSKQRYYCSCDCGKYTESNPKLIVYETMKSGLVTSCGCYRKEIATQTCQSRALGNQYEFHNGYIVGYASNNNQPFYFDVNDYVKVKDYTWYMNKLKYIVTHRNNKSIYMHNLIIDVPFNFHGFVDYINHKTYDNRKVNLRLTTYSQNQMNKAIGKNNTSGVTGVHWHKRDQIWESWITVNKKAIYLGRFKNIKDAIKVRKQAEEKYFGQYSYDNSIDSVQEVQT